MSEFEAWPGSCDCVFFWQEGEGGGGGEGGRGEGGGMQWI